MLLKIRHLLEYAGIRIGLFLIDHLPAAVTQRLIVNIADLTYFFSTGYDWKFADHWSTRFYGRLLSIDYEEGDEGDSDWYLYDADEFGVGAAILYLW